MAYATYTDVAAGFRDLTAAEQTKATAMLSEAALIIDAYASGADAEVKKTGSCRMVRRALGAGDDNIFPMGASQGTVTALGYSQSFTLAGGTTGEIYLSKLEKKLLGVGDKIGSYSPTEELVGCND